MFSPNVDMQEVISSVVEMKLEIIRGERWFVLKALNTAQERCRSPVSLRLKRVKGERGGGGERLWVEKQFGKLVCMERPQSDTNGRGESEVTVHSTS